MRAAAGLDGRDVTLDCRCPDVDDGMPRARSLLTVFLHARQPASTRPLLDSCRHERKFPYTYVALRAGQTYAVRSDGFAGLRCPHHLPAAVVALESVVADEGEVEFVSRRRPACWGW